MIQMACNIQTKIASECRLYYYSIAVIDINACQSIYKAVSLPEANSLIALGYHSDYV